MRRCFAVRQFLLMAFIFIGAISAKASPQLLVQQEGKWHALKPEPSQAGVLGMKPLDVSFTYSYSNISPNSSVAVAFLLGDSTSLNQAYSAFTQTGSTDFVITSNSCSGSSVSTGATCPFTVTFTPTTNSVESTTLTVTFTDTWPDGSTTSGVATFNFSGSNLNLPPANSCALGSIIRVTKQALGEKIPVVGADFDLYYSSEYAPDYVSPTEKLNPAFGFNQEAWNSSVWHFYDQNQRRLFLGSGDAVDVHASTLSSGNYLVVSPDGTETYIFSPAGQHLQTNTFLTGATIRTFSYDSSNHLVGITDAYGNTTTFTRNTSGYVTSITAPYGQVTTMTLDSNGRFLTVTNPNSEIYTLTYQTGTGLLATFTKPSGQVSTFTYDTNGKLTKDLGNGGDFWTLVSGSGGSLTKSSNMGRQTTYSSSYDSGGDFVGGYTTPFGLSYSNNKNIDSSSANASSIEGSSNTKASDERYGSAFQRLLTLVHQKNTTSSTTTFGRSVAYPTGVTPGLYNFSTITDTATTSGRTQTSVFNASTSTQTFTSAEGATQTNILDSHERPTSTQIGSDTATTFSFDTNGRLSGSIQGTNNQKTYAYNTAGFLQSVTNALSQVTSYSYDLSGRVASVTLPDTRVVGYSYDGNGNLTGVTPPNSLLHAFSFNAMELTSTYAPPTLTGLSTVNTTYSYNLDRQLTAINRPDGTTVSFSYGSTTGLLSGITLPNGSYSYSYLTNSDQIATAQSPDGFYNTYTWYGYSVASESQGNSSLMFGKTSFAYDTDHRLTSRSLQGTSSSPTYTEGVTYNNDDKPTQVGSMSLTYTYPSGRLSTTTIGTISDSRTYDSYGNLSGYAATYTPSGGSPTILYSYTLTRDTINRITGKTETIQGTTTTWSYSYDSAGRLSTVLQNGSAYSSYAYDNNSNRTSGSIAGTAFTATYDNQDRVLTFGPRSYSYNANGDVTQIQWSPTYTSYFTFDSLGALKQVSDNSGNHIVFANDGRNRRVQKTLDGSFWYYLIYDDKGHLAASTGNTGVVKKEYVYATGDNAPDYMYYVAGGAIYRIIKDNLGSPRLLVNTANGSVIERIDYNDLGAVVNDTNSGFQHFGFAGGIYDPHTSTVRFGAREYDPNNGRWMTKDPILFQGGDTNLYGYALSDPLNLADYSGLDAKCIDDETCENPAGIGSINGGGPTPTVTTSPMPITPEPTVPEPTTGKPFTPDQSAVVDLAKQCLRTGVTEGNAETLIQWADEAGLTGRIDGAHRPEGSGGIDFDHAHIGPIDHIPLK